LKEEKICYTLSQSPKIARCKVDGKLTF